MGLVRFRSRACRFRTNGTGANSGGRMLCAPTGFRRTVGAAISRPNAFPFRGRCPRRGRMRCAAKGRLRAGPYGKAGEFPVFCRGGCPHPPARPGWAGCIVGAAHWAARPQAFPPEGGRWHGEAVTDEGAYLNRCIPAGAPRQVRKSKGAPRSGRGIPFPKPSPGGSSPCGCMPRPAIGRTSKKFPSAVEQFPPRRGFSVSRESARRHIANEAVMLFLKR